MLPFMRLPSPPSLTELRAGTPSVPKIKTQGRRPFWSVMIPTYNCGPFLRRTMESVLAQALGPDVMQIEVVDGCSTKDDPEGMVRDIGGGRIAFHRLPRNQGPAHTFNTCIERARGKWVHILHGDDIVFPGFYAAYDDVIGAHPEARMVIGQVAIIDENDRWTKLYGAVPPVGGGILLEFVKEQVTRTLTMCPSVVVRRDAYEEAGGFCTLFAHVTDWDMWFRVGQLAPVACVARPYAGFRHHSHQDYTGQLKVAGRNIEECYFAVRVNLARLNGAASSIDESAWRSHWALQAEMMAEFFGAQHCAEGRYNQLLWASRLEPNRRRLQALALAWVRHKLSSNRAAAKR